MGKEIPLCLQYIKKARKRGYLPYFLIMQLSESVTIESMSYKTYRNKSKAKRDELRKEYEEDTGKRTKFLL